MFGSGRTLGFVIILGGLLLACSGSVISVFSVALNIVRFMKVVVMGGLAFLLLSIPLIGVGSFLFWRGKKNIAELKQIKKQKVILTMLKRQGQVKINDAVLELKISREEIQSLIYDLVDRGLFHGYVNWEDSILYPSLASALQGTTACPYCDGEQKFAGKGIIQCFHCNTQVFL